MSRFFAVITLVSFTGIAVFGLWGMGGHMNGFSSCIGSLSQGASCPVNPTASVNFHLNSFKSFSNSPVPQSAESMIIISLTLTLIFAYILIIERFKFPSAIFSLNRENLVKIFETSFQPFKKERISWNTLHENSPNFI